jgi:hypothetical protein
MKYISLLITLLATLLFSQTLTEKNISIYLFNSEYKDSLTTVIETKLVEQGATVTIVDSIPEELAGDAALFIWQGKNKKFPKNLKKFQAQQTVPTLFFLSIGEKGDWSNIDALTAASKESNIDETSNEIIANLIKKMNSK